MLRPLAHLKYTLGISEFLLWWEDVKTKESIVVPEETDAVQIMTIHKSKGLAFNVVMIPFNWEDSKNFQEIWVDTSSHFNKQLPSALVSTSKNMEHSYFRDDYFKEKNLSLLDNLNKLYVAMTRPKERLYVFSKYFPDNVSTEFVKKGNHNIKNRYNCGSSNIPPSPLIVKSRKIAKIAIKSLSN